MNIMGTMNISYIFELEFFPSRQKLTINLYIYFKVNTLCIYVIAVYSLKQLASVEKEKNTADNFHLSDF